MSTAATRMIAPSAAFSAATGLHVVVAAALLWMPMEDITPPMAVGGFEVVDLSAFGVTTLAAPEPVKEEPIEEAKVEPEPEPEPEPIPDPKAVVMEQPKPIELPKKVTPKPIEKKQPKPLQQADSQPQTKPQSESSVGSQNAFVPPTSHAAYLKNPKPAYPPLALRRGIEGLVLLSVEVSQTGQTLSVSLKKSSGFVLLDTAALKAVRVWQFAPATRGGRAVSARVDVPIRFSLNDA